MQTSFDSTPATANNSYKPDPTSPTPATSTTSSPSFPNRSTFPLDSPPLSKMQSLAAAVLATTSNSDFTPGGRNTTVEPMIYNQSNSSYSHPFYSSTPPPKYLSNQPQSAEEEYDDEEDTDSSSNISEDGKTGPEIPNTRYSNNSADNTRQDSVENNSSLKLKSLACNLKTRLSYAMMRIEQQQNQKSHTQTHLDYPSSPSHDPSSSMRSCTKSNSQSPVRLSKKRPQVSLILDDHKFKVGKKTSTRHTPSSSTDLSFITQFVSYPTPTQQSSDRLQFYDQHNSNNNININNTHHQYQQTPIAHRQNILPSSLNFTPSPSPRNTTYQLPKEEDVAESLIWLGSCSTYNR